MTKKDLRKQMEVTKTMRKFRHRPLEIEAVQWDGNNIAEIDEFIGPDLKASLRRYDKNQNPNPAGVYLEVGIGLSSGDGSWGTYMEPGDWLIKPGWGDNPIGWKNQGALMKDYEAV